MSDPNRTLAEFLADLRYEDLPAGTISRCEELCLDWLGSALGGAGQPPTPLFEGYARRMGPATGASETLTDRRLTSPHFAALVNAAASHVIEQDDVHNASVLHPGAVVFPAALAAAQDLGKSGRELIVAAVAGYEAGIRIGEFLGRSHYTVFHTTGTAGTLAAAVAVGKLLDCDRDGFLAVLGSAGTQAAGLWEFLRDAADSKQLHTAKAAADGLLAAYMSADGLTSAKRILDGQQGLATGMSHDADASWLTDRLGSRWALTETSFKYHACCRHTHPSADALLAIMQTHGLRHGDIAAVTARVYQAAIDVLGAVEVPSTVHQAKFSMATVLGLIAVHGKADPESFLSYALQDEDVASFCDRVTMQHDADVEAAYPQKWLGRVEVTTHDGRQLHGAIDDPKGDPGNPLSRAEIEDKFHRLVRFSAAATSDEAEALVRWAWGLQDVPVVTPLMQFTERREGRFA